MISGSTTIFHNEVTKIIKGERFPDANEGTFLRKVTCLLLPLSSDHHEDPTGSLIGLSLKNIYIYIFTYM